MAKVQKSEVKAGIIVVLLIICAVLARVLGKLGYASVTFGLIRTIIYIGLYIAWGVSVRKRVIQLQVRRYLTAVSALMVFWFVVRSMKYYFIFNLDITRYLWYLYYLPTLFIPLLAVYVSMLLGKPENYRLPNWILLLYIPTVVFLLLVLTNDFHQLAFTFPTGEIWSDANNDYGIGYYIVLSWEIICALIAFVMMVFKCRISPRKIYLPIIIMVVSVVYALIYSSGVQWMQVIGGDITAAQCLLFAAIFESCIRCNLIQTNTGYDSLFEVGTFSAQILDTDNQTHYAAANAPKLSKELISKAERGTVRLDKNTLLKSSKIDGGYVLWQEDITAIAELLEQLEENKETLAESNFLEMENYNTKLKINTLREKNRLYDLLQGETAHQIELLDEWLTQYDSETNEEKSRSLLAKIAVVGAYIKRYGNLLFIGEKTDITDTSELSMCLDESLANLELMGVECGIDILQNEKIFVKDAVRAYRFFETIVESSMNTLQSVWLKSRNAGEFIILHIEVECKTGLSEISNISDTCECEDGVWRFTLRFKNVGEQV